jgi:tagatose-1,6-bisphosphate aldolase non-catalytic subunit AgaZ/GatZ
MPGPALTARTPPARRLSGPAAFREDSAISWDRTTIAAKAGQSLHPAVLSGDHVAPALWRRYSSQTAAGAEPDRTTRATG